MSTPPEPCAAPPCDAPDSGPHPGFRRTLAVSASLDGPLAATAVLVRLDAARIDYDAAGPRGETLEFRDRDGNPLVHEIAAWNPSGESQVWLRLPELRESTVLSMLYGGVGAPSSPSGVFSDHGMVIHFETGLTDSSASGQALTYLGGAPGAGRLGSGYGFDGLDDSIDIGTDLPLYSGVSQATLSAWVNLNTSGNGAVIEFSNGTSTSSRVLLNIVGGAPSFGVLTSDDPADPTERFNGPVLATGEWHWILGTVDLAEALMQMYVDGSLVAEFPLVTSETAFPATNSSIAAIGRNDTAMSGYFSGIIDEARARAVFVDADWVSAQYLSMTDGLFEFGNEELR